jgi:hypothetical protein
MFSFHCLGKKVVLNFEIPYNTTPNPILTILGGKYFIDNRKVIRNKIIWFEINTSHRLTCIRNLYVRAITIYIVNILISREKITILGHELRLSKVMYHVNTSDWFFFFFKHIVFLYNTLDINKLFDCQGDNHLYSEYIN